MKEILELIENNGKITIEEIAVLIGMPIDQVASEIEKLEKSKVIVGYSTVIDWDKTDKEFVTALIEVKVTPQRDMGFDKIAARIYNYNQVKACYLMSGGYDLNVLVEGKSLKEVALFVSEKLSIIDGVVSTGTHFVLKKYKDKSHFFKKEEVDDRKAIVL